MKRTTEPAEGVAAQTLMAPSTLPTFLAIVDRVQAVVDAETEALSRNMSLDMAELNRRKRQGLLELNRIMRAFVGTGPHPEARDRLGCLAAKLERNRRLLDVQLRAVREIADIIARSMRDAESDGTYSMLAGGQ